MELVKNIPYNNQHCQDFLFFNVSSIQQDIKLYKKKKNAENWPTKNRGEDELEGQPQTDPNDINDTELLLEGRNRQDRGGRDAGQFGRNMRIIKYNPPTELRWKGTDDVLFLGVRESGKKI